MKYNIHCYNKYDKVIYRITYYGELEYLLKMVRKGYVEFTGVDYAITICNLNQYNKVMIFKEG